MSRYLPIAEAIAEIERGNPPLADSGFLGARLDPRDAAVVLMPVSWEATTSYGGGTSLAPCAILNASHQLDLEDPVFPSPYSAGIAYLESHPDLREMNSDACSYAKKAIAAIETGSKDVDATDSVNRLTSEMVEIVKQDALAYIAQGKHIGLVGGDHSTPLGLLAALAETRSTPFGILHFDAHHDLRSAYEGFTHSHASIFHNVLESIPQVSRLVQVAIRDYSREETVRVAASPDKIRPFYASDLFRMKAEGRTFKAIADQIIDSLPQEVYISFDIDALSPALCPNTGTPVPGGLSFEESVYILEELALSGRKIIGFDLCEVAPGEDEWDANVGARILYKLCGALLYSQQLI